MKFFAINGKKVSYQRLLNIFLGATIFFISSCIATETEQEVIIPKKMWAENIKQEIVVVGNTPKNAPYEDYLSKAPRYAKSLPEKLDIDDPVENANRKIFVFNDGVIKYFLYTTGTGYSFVVRPFIQKRISNAGNNLELPRKLFNNLVQLRLAQSSSVVSRFVLNSTIGLAGIFDFADHTDVSFLKKPPEQTFEKTLAHWDAGTGPYFVIPFLGPSDARGIVGRVVDSPFNVFNYVLSPVGYILTYNDLIYKTVPTYLDVASISYDPYGALRDLSRFALRGQVALEKHTEEEQQKETKSQKDDGIYETINALKYSVNIDKEFALSGKTKKIRFEGEKQSISCGLWLQPQKAPLAVVIPGFAGQYNDRFSLVTAKKFYQKGFSVLTLNSVFTRYFNSGAKTIGFPGFAKRDTQHLYSIIQTLVPLIKQEHPGKISSCSLVGYSLGGLYTLFIAAKEEKLKNPIFNRYVTVNNPGNPSYALTKLDEYFFRSYKGLSEEDKAKRQIKSIGKVVEISSGKKPNVWNTPFNLGIDDVKFLIGFNYYRSLIALAGTNGASCFSGYCNGLLFPELQQELSLEETNDVAKIIGYNSSLWAIQKTLRHNKNITFFVNENDPLLERNSLELLKTLVPKERLKLHKKGGHLGNLIEISDKVITAAKNK